MNIVNYIRFSQDPRQGTQQHPRQEQAEDAFEELETATLEQGEPQRVVEPIPVPNCSTMDWLQRHARLED